MAACEEFGHSRLQEIVNVATNMTCVSDAVIGKWVGGWVGGWVVGWLVGETEVER